MGGTIEETLNCRISGGGDHATIIGCQGSICPQRTKISNNNRMAMNNLNNKKSSNGSNLTDVNNNTKSNNRETINKINNNNNNNNNIINNISRNKYVNSRINISYINNNGNNNDNSNNLKKTNR